MTWTTTVTKRTLMTGAAAALLAVAAARPAAVGTEAAPATQPDARVQRGAYLVRIMGCNDCHTPWKNGPNGPEPDMTRALTGHPQDLVMPTPARLAAPWTWSAATMGAAAMVA